MLTALFFDDAMAFEEAAKKQHFQEAEKEAQKRKREIAQAEKRIAELDRIFKRIYEDDISGAISHERFLKLSADYEAEQKELTEQVKAWRQAVETFEQDQADFASFAAIVRKYVGIRELTPTIVNEFVKKIIVHAPDKSSGHRRQKIELVWNFIGEVNLPSDDQTVERQRKDRTHDLSAMPPCDNQITSLWGAPFCVPPLFFHFPASSHAYHLHDSGGQSLSNRWPWVLHQKWSSARPET